MRRAELAEGAELLLAEGTLVVGGHGGLMVGGHPLRGAAGVRCPRRDPGVTPRDDRPGTALLRIAAEHDQKMLDGIR